LNIDKINEIALSSNIQAANFSVEGVGKGTKGNDHTFFILVKSKDLLLVRQKILKNTDQDTRIFDPQHFFPHITIGFTSRDLHEADGVIKDKSSFYTELKLI
jgi:2'-5' RNA ligase